LTKPVAVNTGLALPRSLWYARPLIIPLRFSMNNIQAMRPHAQHPSRADSPCRRRL